MKVLFLQEYIRENHMKQQNDGSFKNVFFNTKGGKTLKKLVEDGLGLKKDEYYIDYAYGYVPKVIKRDNYNRAVKYKPPTQTEAKGEYPYLFEKIVKEKPDIIIPTGNVGCKALLDKAAITKIRGVPEKVTVSYAEYEYSGEYDTEDNPVVLSSKEYSHEVWVLPMYSMEYMLVNPNIQNLVDADLVTLDKFIREGEKAFSIEDLDYEFVTDIDRIRDVFNRIVKEHPTIAWDLETNTLRPESKGAKPLVMSLSYKEGEGMTIPLEHKDFNWDSESLNEIYGMIREFVADPNIQKVGQNLQYDMKFLRLTKGFTKFSNNLDTKVLYFLTVSQEESESIKLSDLAYELTEMGGYDKPLDEFIEKYKKEYQESERKRVAEEKKSNKEEVKNLEIARKEETTREGKAKIQEKIDEVKARKPKMVPLKNEIDGGNFNYEWIPLKSDLHPYASGDSDACLRIFNSLYPLLEKQGEEAEKLFLEHYPPLEATLSKMEALGVPLDIEYNKKITEAYREEGERLIEEMREYPEVKELEEQHLALYQAGLEEWAKPKAERDEEKAKLRDRFKNKLKFNPNASADKQRVLYDIGRGFPPFNKEHITNGTHEDGIEEEDATWENYKADVGTIEYIKDNYEHLEELANLLLQHSLVKSRLQTFTYRLLERVDEKGVLHGGYNITGTDTSRLSSNNPNFQNIPASTGDVKRFDYKYPIKRMFISRFEDGVMAQLDYSSLEARILALAAGDEDMTQSFLEDGDIHSDTASLVFNKPAENITKDERDSAKSTTFGGKLPTYTAKYMKNLTKRAKSNNQ